MRGDRARVGRWVTARSVDEGAKLGVIFRCLAVCTPGGDTRWGDHYSNAILAGAKLEGTRNALSSLELPRVVPAT